MSLLLALDASGCQDQLNGLGGEQMELYCIVILHCMAQVKVLNVHERPCPVLTGSNGSLLSIVWHCTPFTQGLLRVVLLLTCHATQRAAQCIDTQCVDFNQLHGILCFAEQRLSWNVIICVQMLHTYSMFVSTSGLKEAFD
jgi:hypothetical protein